MGGTGVIVGCSEWGEAKSRVGRFWKGVFGSGGTKNLGKNIGSNKELSQLVEPCLLNGTRESRWNM